MDLHTYLLENGPATKLAREIGAHAPDVSDWRSGRRPVPIGRCVAIESATRGAVTRRDLRPHDFWRIWPDLAHLKPADAA